MAAPSRMAARRGPRAVKAGSERSRRWAISPRTMATGARSATVVPVYRQLTGDTLTPVSAFCKIQEGDWAFLFESVVGGERLGRYSFLGSGPFLSFQAFDRKVQVSSPSGREELEHPDPL